MTRLDGMCGSFCIKQLYCIVIYSLCPHKLYATKELGSAGAAFSSQSGKYMYMNDHVNRGVAGFAPQHPAPERDGTDVTTPWCYGFFRHQRPAT